MRVSLIIPALNEAGNIYQLVSDILAVLPVQTLVVDNGSEDETTARARSAGAQVISEPRRGYGYACASGVAATTDAEILVFLDGDYSFLPAELPSVLSPILEGKADLVLGSRWLGKMETGAMPPHQRFGNWLASHIMNLLYGLDLTDIGPYRAVRRSLLMQLDMREMTYGWPVEMILKAARCRARIKEVPVSYHPRRSGRSKVSGTIKGSLLAAWFMVGVPLRYAWSWRPARKDS